MENNVTACERHKIIDMLTVLLEKVNLHDGIVDRIDSKKREIKNVQKQIDVPRKRFGFFQMFFGIIFIVIGWIILLTVYLVRKNKYKKLQAELAEKKKKLTQELDEINAELDSYISAELEPYISTLLPDRFPARYCMNAVAIEHMLSLAIDLRGDTIKKIINLYEEECHRARVESLLGGVVKNVRATAIKMEQVARASEAAAASSAAAASAAVSAAASAQMAASRPAEVDVTVENNITIS